MKINVHVERLVLEGLPGSTRRTPILKAALTTELARLLQSPDLWNAVPSSTAVPRMKARDLRVNTDASPNRLGVDIARAINDSFNSLGGKPSSLSEKLSRPRAPDGRNFR